MFIIVSRFLSDDLTFFVGSFPDDVAMFASQDTTVVYRTKNARTNVLTPKVKRKKFVYFL